MLATTAAGLGLGQGVVVCNRWADGSCSGLGRTKILQDRKKHYEQGQEKWRKESGNKRRWFRAAGG
jgi:hypothetical protein